MSGICVSQLGDQLQQLQRRPGQVPERDRDGGDPARPGLARDFLDHQVRSPVHPPLWLPARPSFAARPLPGRPSSAASRQLTFGMAPHMRTRTASSTPSRRLTRRLALAHLLAHLVPLLSRTLTLRRHWFVRPGIRQQLLFERRQARRLYVTLLRPLAPHVPVSTRSPPRD